MRQALQVPVSAVSCRMWRCLLETCGNLASAVAKFLSHGCSARSGARRGAMRCLVGSRFCGSAITRPLGSVYTNSRRCGCRSRGSRKGAMRSGRGHHLGRQATTVSCGWQSAFGAALHQEIGQGLEGQDRARACRVASKTRSIDLRITASPLAALLHATDRPSLPIFAPLVQRGSVARSDGANRERAICLASDRREPSDNAGLRACPDDVRMVEEAKRIARLALSRAAVEPFDQSAQYRW